MDVVKRLAKMLRPSWTPILIGLLMQLVAIASRLIMPYLTRTVVNEVITNGVHDLLIPVCAGILGLTLARGGASYLRAYLMENASQKLVYDIRTGLYKHLQEMPFEFYDKHRIGEIMSRMTGDIEGIRNLVAGGLVTIEDNLLMFIGSLIFMSFMSWKLMLTMLIFAPILCVIAFRFNKRIRPAFRNIREQNAVLNTRTQENLAGVRVVKAFAQEEFEKKRFSDENIKVLDMNIVATRIWAVYNPVLEMLSALCTPVMLLGGGTMVLTGQMDIGTLVGITGYIWMITNPMRMLSNIMNMFINAVTSAEKLFYYIDLGSSIKEAPDAVQPAKYEGHVVFDHVNFTYGDQSVLKDVCFEAKPGQTVAIMGATGSGKSTVVQLISRFYDIPGTKNGAVYVDGIDVKKHKLKPLRRTIGFAMQETFLFSDSLEDNVRFGAPDAAFERVSDAAHVAEADGFIQEMPQGYDTVVGERGLGLSGGQKQRVAIARAVLPDPKILILDDSTSAVDMETEYEIQRNLEKVMKGRTTFIIAHRISSVKNADQILVMDNGRIAERGTHKTLLEQKGIYYQMFMDQYRDFEEMSAAGKKEVG